MRNALRLNLYHYNIKKAVGNNFSNRFFDDIRALTFKMIYGA